MTEKIITWNEFGKHIYPHDCWVMVRQKIYNVSDFIVEHPGGDDVLTSFSGRDGTDRFEGIPHSEYAVSLRDSKIVGKIQSPNPPQGYLDDLQNRKKQKQKKKLTVRIDKIPLSEVAAHRSEDSCWIVLEDKVYDVSDYLKIHPGGIGKIMAFAGKDATKAFDSVNHSMEASRIKSTFFIGQAQTKSSNILTLIGILIGMAGIIYLFRSQYQ